MDFCKKHYIFETADDDNTSADVDHSNTQKASILGRRSIGNKYHVISGTKCSSDRAPDLSTFFNIRLGTLSIIIFIL